MRSYQTIFQIACFWAIKICESPFIKRVPPVFGFWTTEVRLVWVSFIYRLQLSHLCTLVIAAIEVLKCFRSCLRAVLRSWFVGLKSVWRPSVLSGGVKEFSVSPRSFGYFSQVAVRQIIIRVWRTANENWKRKLAMFKQIAFDDQAYYRFPACHPSELGAEIRIFWFSFRNSATKLIKSVFQWIPTIFRALWRRSVATPNTTMFFKWTLFAHARLLRLLQLIRDGFGSFRMSLSSRDISCGTTSCFVQDSDFRFAAPMTAHHTQRDRLTIESFGKLR